VSFPDGWFAAACTPNIGIATLQLSGSVALMGARDGSIKLKTPCTADGFIQLDLAKQAALAIALPPQAQMNASQVLNADVNDYVYSYNPSAARGVTDTVYVLDGSTVPASLLPVFTLPSGIAGFLPPGAIPDLNLLIAVGVNRAAGDGGLVIFDLDNSATRVLPVPANYQSISFEGVLLTTRKVLARGTLQGARGSRLLIYDLSTNDVTEVPNPEGVVFVGDRPTTPRPGGAGGAGGPSARPLLSVNSKANTALAVGLDADGNQVGIMVVRIP
jgi:hypothetical protein